MKFFTAMLSIAVTLFACGLPVLAEEKEKDKSKQQEPQKGAQQKDMPNPNDAGEGLASFGKILPVGQQNIDVRIPSFSDGVPSSIIRAVTMTRVDENQMNMEKLDIRLIDNLRQNDLRVQLPTATFNMGTNVLTSQQRGRISREDFQIEGDTLIYDTNTGQAKMTGHVHMIIFDTDSFKKKPDDAGVKPKDATKDPVQTSREPEEKKK